MGPVCRRYGAVVALRVGMRGALHMRESEVRMLDEKFKVLVDWEARDCDGPLQQRSEYTLTTTELEKLIGGYVMSASHVERIDAHDDEEWTVIATGSQTEEGYSRHTVSFRILNEEYDDDTESGRSND